MTETLKDRANRKHIKTRAYKRKYNIPRNISSENITIDENKATISVVPRDTDEYKELLMKVDTNIVKVEPPMKETLIEKIKRIIFRK